MASKKKSNQTVRMATPEQLKQVWALVLQALPTRLTWAQAQHWIGRGPELITKIRAIFAEVDPYREQVEAWRKFYAEVFGLTVDLSALHIPEPKSGFAWLLVVVPGITIEMVLAACAKRFKVWRWTQEDLDQLTESVRSAEDGSYAVWVRARDEADQEHANKSYNDLKAANVNGITLLERLLLELKNFLETGQHLDLQNITLCSGSLDRGGDVPSVDWSGGRLYVSWCGRDAPGGRLRSREVVQ